MKCLTHPNTEAIGSCASCGRGVCQECHVWMNNLIYCKECVVRSNSAAPQPQAAPAPPPPNQYGPPVGMQPNPPKPIGPPDPGLFKEGALACLLIIGLSIPILIVDLGYAFSKGSWRYSSNVDLILNFVNLFLIISYFLFSRGIIGFYWNFGDFKARWASALIIIGTLINFTVAVLFTVLTFQWNSGNYATLGYLIILDVIDIISSIIMGIAFVLIFMSLRTVRMSSPPGSPFWDLSTIAGYLFLALSIISFIPFGLLLQTFYYFPPVWNIVTPITFFVMWRVFVTVPMSASPQMYGPVPPPVTYPPGRTI